jgi:hypothetical protein
VREDCNEIGQIRYLFVLIMPISSKEYKFYKSNIEIYPQTSKEIGLEANIDKTKHVDLT